MSMSSSLKAVLTGVVSGKILWDAPLSVRTTYRVGGPADALVTLLDVKEVQAVLRFCYEENVAWKLIGRGSNILASDDGFRGVIIVLGKGFKYINRLSESPGEYDHVQVGAAVGLPRFADWSASKQLSGFEFASGIPGTIGGAVVMNAGAWGKSMVDVIAGVELTDCDQTRIIDAKNLTFSYRCCDTFAARKKDSVLTGVLIKLRPGDSGQIRATMHNLLQKRKERQPLGLPNGGSVFKNPENDSAGRLIEAAGLKGMRIGDAEVSEKHANFIVNQGGASAADILSLMDRIKIKVKQQSGVELIPEVEIL